MGITTVVLSVLCFTFLGLFLFTAFAYRKFLSENARLKQTEEHLQQQLTQTTEKLQSTEETLEEKNQRCVELEIKLRSAESVINSEKSLLDKAQDSFKTLATEALEGTNKSFLELAKSTLDKSSATHKSELDIKKTAIEELLKPLNENLKTYQTHITEVEKSRVQSYTQLEGELKRIVSSHDSLNKTTTALKDALKKPHIRGRWGEVQLKNCVELAGMSEYSDVSFQDTTTLEDGKMLRPDMIVRMPGGRKVIVDSKTPIDAFMSSLEATSEEERHTEMLRHGKHVKKHVQDLSTKDYAKEIKGSADFTVMFLPNESFLYAALEVEPDLVEYALERKILIATPPTLIGLLKVIRYGWNEDMLTENAHRISEAGKELHKRVCDFMEAFMGIGKHLEKAKEEYDKGLTRLESRVLVQTKRLEKLGAKSKKSLPIELDIEAEERLLSDNPEANI